MRNSLRNIATVAFKEWRWLLLAWFMLGTGTFLAGWFGWTVAFAAWLGLWLRNLVRRPRTLPEFLRPPEHTCQNFAWLTDDTQYCPECGRPR